MMGNVVSTNESTHRMAMQFFGCPLVLLKSINTFATNVALNCVKEMMKKQLNYFKESICAVL